MIRRRFALGFLAALLVLLVVGPAGAGDSGARFSAITGQVEVRPDEDLKGWKFARFETVLAVLDHIRTGEDSSSVLSFADMSTFVLKAESEVVIATPPGKDSKVKLMAGNIWVNVKKMIKDGSMEIEMSQVVAGIKGTNITCSSRTEEDWIQVLRGEAEATVKASQEKIHLKEGEALVVKKGGKSETTTCDPVAVQQEWKAEIQTMGESIDLNEIPDSVKGIILGEAQTFKDLSGRFKTLSALAKVTQADAGEFRKTAERFLGVLMEHQMILGGISERLNRAAAASPTKAAQAHIAVCRKLVTQATAGQQEYLAEIQKMLRVNLVKGGSADNASGTAGVATSTPAVTATGTSGVGTTGPSDDVATPKEGVPGPPSREDADSGEVDAFLGEIGGTLSSVESLLSELGSDLSGNGQDFFAGAIDRCNDAIGELGNLLPRLEELQEKFPSNPSLSAVQKQISGYQIKLGSLIKTLAVVEIDARVMTEITDSEETMSAAILRLKDELDSYALVANGSKAGSDKIQATLRILASFSSARRQYSNIQKLYEATIRSVSTNKFKTKEHEDLETAFERVSNTFQMLGIIIEQLESRLRDIEGQTSPFLK
ncbi:MAG: FecR domain-containing protein [Candidatus Riflebacteria bacterium]|nr:FecR domain-containing protein [Candidatus Riflebacteria bacterium]